MATPGFRALRAGFPHARIAVHVRPAWHRCSPAPWFDARDPAASRPRAGTRAARRKASRCAGALRSRALPARLVLGGAADAGRRACGKSSATRAGPRRAAARSRGPRRRAVRGRRVMMARERHVLGLIEALGCRRCGTPPRALRDRGRGATRATRCWRRSGSPGRRRARRARAGRLVRVFEAVARRITSRPSATRSPPKAPRGDDRLPGEAPLAAARRRGACAPGRDVAGGTSRSRGPEGAAAARARAGLQRRRRAPRRGRARRALASCCFGPTSLAKTNLNLERVRALAADVACRPCYHRTCPTDHRCMTRLGAEHVIEAALPALPRTPLRSWRGEEARTVSASDRTVLGRRRAA